MKRISDGSYRFDDDVALLIMLLLRKHAKDNADYQRYGDNIQAHMSFDIANRGLGALGCLEESPKPPPEPKE